MPDSTAVSDPDLKKRWTAFRAENPNVRIRNAAAELGVSEAELVAVSDGVTRLDGEWGTLLNELETLGEVMALTRNDACVHEKTGVYRNVTLIEDHRMGQVADEQIDLRIFFDHWTFGFAVETPWKGGEGAVRRSLQFFDAHGTAVHKVFLTKKSDVEAYERLVDSHRHADEVPPFRVERKDPAPRPQMNPDVDENAFLDGWSALKDTHDFFPLLRDHRVGRHQAVRIAEGTFSERVAPSSAREALQHAQKNESPIMVFVGSPGCIQIHTGPVYKLKETPPWYNVLDADFQLHLNEDSIVDAWVVRKPTIDGIVTALEIYDEDASLIVQLFGKRKPPEPERDDWREIVDALPRL